MRCCIICQRCKAAILEKNHMKNAKRIFIQKGDQFHKFIHFGLELKSDGSLYFSYGGEGQHSGYVRQPKIGDVEYIEYQKLEKLNFKVSYHSSGCIKYHGLGRLPFRYFEPLAKVTQINQFFSLSLNNVDRLKEVPKPSSDANNIVIDCTDLAGTAWFDLCIVPLELHVPYDTGMEFQLTNWLKLVISISHIPTDPIEQGQYNTGLGCQIPIAGLFEQQALDQHEAKIRFFQKYSGTNGYILCAPNGEGVRRLIYDCPKEKHPKVEISEGATCSPLTMNVVPTKDQTPFTELKFRVLNKHGHVIKKDMPKLKLTITK